MPTRRHTELGVLCLYRRYVYGIIIAVIISVFAAGCGIFPKATSSSPGATGTSLISGIIKPMTASLGGISAVGALAVLFGLIALWGLGMRKAGLGLIISGIVLSASAYMIQAYAGIFAFLLILLVVGGGEMIARDAALRSRVKKQAREMLKDPKEERAATALLRLVNPKTYITEKEKIWSTTQSGLDLEASLEVSQE